jgi:hypothetical protein
MALFALCSHAGALYQFDCNAPGYLKCDWPDLKITLLVDPLPGQHLPGPYEHSHDVPIAWIEVQWAGLQEMRFDRQQQPGADVNSLASQIFVSSTRFPGELAFSVAGLRYGEPNPFLEPVLILNLSIRRGINDLPFDPVPLDQLWNTPFSIFATLRESGLEPPYFTRRAIGGAMLLVEDRNKVPEMGTMSLLSLGFIGLLFGMRQRRDRAPVCGAAPR